MQSNSRENDVGRLTNRKQSHNITIGPQDNAAGWAS
jgi:hypothetical protein